MSTNSQSPKNLKFPITCLVIAAVISTAGYFGGIQPVIQNAHASLILENSLIQQSQTLTQTLDQVTKQEQSLSKIITSIKANHIILLPVNLLNKQISEITKLADQVGVTFEKIKPDYPISGQHYQTIPIKINGTGTYRSCTNFFNKLHAKYNDVGIASFELKGNPTKPDGSATFVAHHPLVFSAKSLNHPKHRANFHFRVNRLIPLGLDQKTHIYLSFYLHFCFLYRLVNL